MPKPTREQKKPGRPQIVLYELPGKGNIDPRLIRHAIVEVRDRRIKEEAEGKAKARLQSNS